MFAKLGLCQSFSPLSKFDNVQEYLLRCLIYFFFFFFFHSSILNIAEMTVRLSELRIQNFRLIGIPRNYDWETKWRPSDYSMIIEDEIYNWPNYDQNRRQNISNMEIVYESASHKSHMTDIMSGLDVGLNNYMIRLFHLLSNAFSFFVGKGNTLWPFSGIY